MSNKNQLFKFLDTLAIPYEVFNHPPVYTVEEAAQLASHVPGPACKNLFLKDNKKHFWLIVACANTKIELKKISKQLSVPELRFARTDLLMEHLGVLPGSVTPLALINNTSKNITIIFDEKLQQYPLVGFHPLENNATVVLALDDLIKFIQGCGNSIIFMDFAKF